MILEKLRTLPTPLSLTVVSAVRADSARTAESAARASFADRASRADFADRAGNADLLSGLSVSALESRFDGRYVNVGGDTMTGDLIIKGAAAAATFVMTLTDPPWVWAGISGSPKDTCIGWAGDRLCKLSIYTNGTIRATRKEFVADHPTDPTKSIVYVSLEGPEDGIYIRGTAQLQDGGAVIELPEHFRLIASEERLTVQLTPLGEWLQLYVVEKSPKRIIVHEANGKSGQFDYLVMGIRKGYENHQVIQLKQGMAMDSNGNK
jgi:hypothetical protein